MRRNVKKQAAILSAAAAVGLFNPWAVKATTYNWNVASGDVNTAANWNPVAVPGTADTAYINNSGTARLLQISS